MGTEAVAADGAELRRRQAASQRGFYRTIASASPEARLFEQPGVQATIVPIRPSFAFFNSVFYDDAQTLERTLPAVAREYARAGVPAWTVWVPPGDADARGLLEDAGHVCDSAPLLMAAAISGLDLDGSRDFGDSPQLKLVAEASWSEVARCNDRAHGVPEPWTMAAVFEDAQDPACHLYALARDGAVVSALAAREQDADCYFWFVATVPEAQREGLASALMRHALREAGARGCTTTTLESTPAGEAVYARLGYAPLGRYEMWEWRAG
jgi:GNAT superfamily N-acetyltransferase